MCSRTRSENTTLMAATGSLGVEQCNAPSHSRQVDQCLHGRRSSRTISAPWWVAQNHASSWGSLAGTCSMTKPSHEAPSLGWERSLLAVEPEELMQDAAVSHVDLRRLDLALTEIGVPRLELAKYESIGQRVEIAPRG